MFLKVNIKGVKPMKTLVLRLEKLEAKIKKQGIGTEEELDEYTRLFEKWTKLNAEIISKWKIMKTRKVIEKLRVENRELKKYKAIWEDFNHYPHLTVRNVQELIIELQQKYFPKKEKNGESRINRTKTKKNKN